MNSEQIKTNNFSSRVGNAVNGIILHFTAGGDIEGTIKWFQNPNSQASAHYIVSRSGRIVNMVSEDLAAWHAGSPKGTAKLNGRGQLNLWTIGIEICNWGWLYEADKDETIIYDKLAFQRKCGEIYTRFRGWTFPFHGQKSLHIIESSVLTNKQNTFPGGNKCCWWESYSVDQINAVKELLKDILKRYPHINRPFISTHQNVDPTRKLDTGPAFPYQDIMNELFQSEGDRKEYCIAPNTFVTEKTMRDTYDMHRDISPIRRKWF